MIPVFRISGYSNSGKTSAIEQMLPSLKRHGLRVAVVKHSHHTAGAEGSGKDTERYRLAGADIVEFVGAGSERTVGEVLAEIDGVDLIIVEGMKFM